MCLESKIVELTEAVRALTVAMSGGATEAPAKVEESKPEPKKEEAPKATTKPAAKPVEVKPEPVAEQTTAEAPDYEKDVKPALVKLSTGMSRDEFLQFLSRFGVNSAKNLLPEQYADVLLGVYGEMAKREGV